MKHAILLAALFSAAASLLHAEIPVKAGDKVAFLGDSITQQGNGGPGGYVQLVGSGLAANGVKVEIIGAGISGIAANFLKVLTANRRLFAVADVIRAFRALVAKFKGEATAEVTVAEPLSDTNLDALKAALKSVSGKDVDLNVKIDPSIIGGLVVKLGSRMIDSSLRTKLNSIKHAMKEAG